MLYMTATFGHHLTTHRSKIIKKIKRKHYTVQVGKTITTSRLCRSPNLLRRSGDFSKIAHISLLNSQISVKCHIVDTGEATHVSCFTLAGGMPRRWPHIAYDRIYSVYPDVLHMYRKLEPEIKKLSP